MNGSFGYRLVNEGRPLGGPLFLAVLALLAGACGRGPGRIDTGPSGPLGRPLETYQQLGFLAGPGHFPAVAGFSTMAGPGDSTWVLLGLSMPSRALRFQRVDAGFLAEYNVAATFLRESQVVKRFERNETVRVPTFAETGRTDESVVFQHAVALPPGRYEVTLDAADANSTRGFRVRDTLDVPAYGKGASELSRPVVVYEGSGRTRRDAPPDLILNPRHTIAYGDDSPRIYVEAYGGPESAPIVVRIVDEGGRPVWSTSATMSGDAGGVRHALVELPAAELPLGKLWLEVAPSNGAGAANTRSPLVISISDEWMVANVEEVLDLLEYIATPEEVDSLRAALPDERRERWDAFWTRRDPLSASANNEFRDEFFRRVRFATEQFPEDGRVGWKTDRGEVFIVFGPPSSSRDRQLGGRADVARASNAVEWVYDSLPGGRLELLFADRTGFGRFELTPPSRAAFRSAADRLMRVRN